MSDSQPTVPYGFCQCGCGEKTNLAERTVVAKGMVQGEPCRFRLGHRIRLNPRRPLKDRFWAKVDKRGPAECWEWTGYRAPTGYGLIGLGPAVAGMGRAHRVSYELNVGPIPPGLHVLHTCDNPPCVNPAHLWVGTHAENQADKAAKGRSTKGRRMLALSKLTDADKEQIRRLRSQGLIHREIAAEFGVSRTRVGQIIRDVR